VVCRQLDRRCIALEIDPEVAARVQIRLAALLPMLPGMVYQQSTFGEEQMEMSGSLC
jgi:hypothetical protein